MASTGHKSATTSKVLKALSVFGGVQVVTILCSVVRTKLAALWIGPLGVGLLTIYNSTIDLISQTAQLNLSQTSVRDLSQNRADAVRGPQTVAVVRKLAILLGVIGLVFVVLMSPFISRFAFGDGEHTWTYVALSFLVLAVSYTNGELSIMRGYDRLKPLAKCSLWTAIGLITCAVPLFYFFRLDGIVPLLLLSTALGALIAYFFRVKDVPQIRVTIREAWQEGRGMLGLGFYMTVSGFVSLLSSNLFIVYLNLNYGETTVGFYQSGYTLVNTYVGLIFNAITMEYYPRLSSVIRHRHRAEVVVSHEIKIALLVLMPVAVCFICFSEVIMRILYTPDFLSALPFVVVGATGVIFRAVSWCMAYVILAKGDGRIYILTETLSAIAYLALYIPLFANWTFSGLGWAYLLWYAFYFAVVYLVCRYRYSIRLRTGISRLTLLALVVVACAVVGYYTIGRWWTLLLLLPPTLIYTYRRLVR